MTVEYQQSSERRVVPALTLLVFFSSGLFALRLRDIPQRIDPLVVPKPDSETILLWRFENDLGTDSSPFENNARVKGDPVIDPLGRHGKCLLLNGSGDALFVARLEGFSKSLVKRAEYELSIDFWCRFDRGRSRNESLLEFASSSGRPALRLELDTENHLVLSGEGLRTTVSEKPLPPAQWFHIGIRSRELYQPNRIYVDKTGVEVLVNGFEWVSAYSEQRYYRFPPPSMLGAFVLGNSLLFDRGFEGKIDEFRLSNARRMYCQLLRQEWLDPGAKRPIERNSPYFRNPQSLLLYLSFDSPEEIEKVLAPEKSVTPEREKPPVVAHTTEEPEEEPEELIEELVEGDVRPLEQTSGVRGKALIVRGGRARFRLPRSTTLRDGTIEFWVKPGNWDNLTVHPGKHATFRYRHSSLHLLTLCGRPKRDAEPVPLVSVRAYRLQGKLPVSEEYRKYYPNMPEVPLMPHKWTHIALYWGRNVKHYQPRLYFDGRQIRWEIRHRTAKLADPSLLEECKPEFIEFGNILETAFDEIRIYPYAFLEDEIENSIAQYKGEQMRELSPCKVNFDYRLPAGLLGVELIPLLLRKVSYAELALELPRKKLTARVDGLEKGSARVELQVGDLPEGDYPLKGALFNPEGRRVANFQATFDRMSIPWLNNRIGILDTPPPPFEPVRVERTTASVVLRKYRIADDGNFSEVIVKGEQILARRIHFELQTRGRIVAFKPEELRLGEHDALQANWEASASAPGLRIKSRAKLEYDGMVRYELELLPLKELAMDRLSLIIPLQEKYALLYHILPVGGDFRAYETAGYLPSGEGVIWDSKSWSGKNRITRRPLGNFVPMVWLGGVIRGLCWFADNDQGWIPSDSSPAVEILRKKATVYIRINFVSEGTVLREPRKLIYALLATPPKPLPKNYRHWARGNLKKYGPVAGRIMSCDSFAPWVVPVRENAMDFWPIGYDWEFAKKCSDIQRYRSHHGKYPPGQALMLYHDRRFVPLPRDALYFAWEWQRKRHGAWPKSKIDCLLWYMNNWFGRSIMDGLYIDDTFPVPDYNWQTSSAYKLPDGRIQPGASFFAYREYLKRLYSIFYIYQKPPIITSHMSCTLAIPFHSFFTAIYDGEASGRFSSLNRTFIDAWALDRMMTLDIAERTGLVTMFMFKTRYLERFNKEQWAPSIWRAHRAPAGICLLFDMNMPIYQLRDALAPYYEEDVQVLPFWKNQDIVSMEPLLEGILPTSSEELEKLLPSKTYWKNEEFRRSIARQPFRVTIYKKPDRVLLVVVNFLRAKAKARIKLNLDRLGVSSDKRTKVNARDIDTWKKPEGIDILSAKKPAIKEAEKLLTEREVEDEQVQEALVLKKEEKDLDFNNGTITVTVEPHNFRLIELNWR